MDDIDKVLARLAAAPIPAGLDGLEARVFAGIGKQPTTRSAGLGLGAIMVTALAMGMASTGIPTAASADASASLMPLGGIFPLAPSTLLAGTP